MRGPEIQVLHEMLTSCIVKAEDIGEHGVVVAVLRAKMELLESERLRESGEAAA